MALNHHQMARSLTLSDLSMPRKVLKITPILTQESRLCCETRYKANTKAFQVHSHVDVYQKTIWSQDFIEGLETNFSVNWKEKVIELEGKVIEHFRNGENGSLSCLQLLELIDNIERLGLGYRFQPHITRILDRIVLMTNEKDLKLEEDTLHAASLKFRLLRQHGYSVSSGFLRRFMDSHGDLIGCLQKDIKGILSLYEASYLALEGETDLHEAKLFSTEILQMVNSNGNEVMDYVNHALNIPLYRETRRLQARWYIEAYGKRKDANQIRFELATLDFNMVQSQLKKDLQEVSRWWNDTGLARELNFIRDRVVECFFWSVGLVFEPQYHRCLVGLTKVATLITTIDDIYDVYGSLDELRFFTDAVRRWDINAVKHMPQYMQLAFLALYNTVNEMSYNTLISQGKNIIPILGKMWGDLLEAFLVEAKWAHNKYIPPFEEYLDNAWRSVSGVVILTHGYFLINDQYNKKDATEHSLERFDGLLKWSSMIFRLCNDLGTSSDEIDRGKSSNAISCYMHQNGVSEEVAREYIETIINESWKKLIEARVGCSKEVADPFIEMAINLARISHCTYQYGDGHGAPDARAKGRVLSVIIEPITIKY